MEAEIISRTRENLTLSASENDVLHSEQSTMVTEMSAVAVYCKSKVTSASPHRLIDGADSNCALGAGGISKQRRGYLKMRNSNFPLKNKRKRRRGKPKCNTKPYKKSNWKFQKPRSQQDGGSGSGGGRNGMRSKLVRSRSIVPYNTNDFLMEEHMADVPGARHTPSGRTRDSSFSVDSEDNYFFSMPEDEEEFLTKEFADVYERARVERLESMTKQQLVEECLQLEHKYADGSTGQVTGNGATEFINKIRILEERIRALSTENIDLRRRLERRNIANNKQTAPDPERMCSSTSEDSESDSNTSSSCSSSDYSGHSRRSCSISDDDDDLGDVSNERKTSSRMDSDDIVTDQSVQNLSNGQLEEREQRNVIVCNGIITTNGPLSPSLSATASVEASVALAAASTSSSLPSSPHQQQEQQLSPAQESQLQQ